MLTICSVRCELASPLLFAPYSALFAPTHKTPSSSRSEYVDRMIQGVKSIGYVNVKTAVKLTLSRIGKVPSIVALVVSLALVVWACTYAW